MVYTSFRTESVVCRSAASSGNGIINTVESLRRIGMNMAEEYVQYIVLIHETGKPNRRVHIPGMISPFSNITERFVSRDDSLEMIWSLLQDLFKPVEFYIGRTDIRYIIKKNEPYPLIIKIIIQ